MNHSSEASAKILVIGMGWFPTKPGGNERYTYELISYLRKQDQVEFCGFGLPDLDNDLPLKLTNFGEPDRPLWQRLQAIQKRFTTVPIENFDVINFHFPLYSLPIFSKSLTSLPSVFTFHGPWAYESQKSKENMLKVSLKKWLEQQLYKRFDRFITLSHAFAKILNEDYYVPLEKIHVIPGGVDPNKFQINCSRKQARLKLGWPSDRFILFSPRRLVPRMGIDKLLIAVSKLVIKHGNVWLAIAGQGELRQALEQQKTQLNLDDHVKFLGYLPDQQLPLAYQAADLTVVPSQALEGFGLILLESLACGTPPLCTPVGGMPEVIHPFDPSLITESTEVDDIADRLNDIMSGTVTLPERQVCYDYAYDNFCWEHIAQKVRSVLLNQ